MAHRDIPNQQSMRMNASLYRYTKGYHFNIYVANSVVEGGPYRLTRAIPDTVADTPEQWAEKTVLYTGAVSIVRSEWPRVM